MAERKRSRRDPTLEPPTVAEAASPRPPNHAPEEGRPPPARRHRGPHHRHSEPALHSAPAGSEPVLSGTLGRTSRLLRFAIRYRHLGGPAEHAGDAHARPAHDDPQAFAQELKTLGPAFVKIGQILSTRADLLPPAYLDALAQLQDDVGPEPFDAIRDTIENELGCRLSKAFADFDPTPLATASLAQVHAATLRDGREVVVKVQRPGIAEAIASDLKMLDHLAGAADRWTEQGRRLRFARWLEEVADTLAEELDYRLEAENLETFARNLEEFPLILVPLPCADLSSARVLTMDRIEGGKVSQAIELRRLEQPLGALAETLLHAYLDQIFVNGLVHADPHPGNVLLTRDNRIGLIDLGMVIRLSPRMRDAMLKLLFAVVEGDSDSVADQSMEISERLEMFNERAWRRRCSRLIGRYSGSAHLAESEGQLMIELTRLSVECGLRPPPEMALLGKTLLHLDTVARLLDPHVDVRGVVRERMRKLLPSRLGNLLSPTAAAEQALEVASMMRDMPRQLRSFMSLLADNRFTVQVAGLEESRLLENLQKIANRIAAGIVTAALIVGAALALRIDAGPTLFGYPALALLMFLSASILGAVLVISSLRSDRHASKYRARR
jgi:ubiquinone biosynthesis protein